MDDVEYCRYPDPLINNNKNWTGFWDFGMKGGGMGGLDNPWVGGTLMTPFDQEVSLNIPKIFFMINFIKFLIVHRIKRKRVHVLVIIMECNYRTPQTVLFGYLYLTCIQKKLWKRILIFSR